MKGFESGTTWRGRPKRARVSQPTYPNNKEHNKTQIGNPQVRVAEMHLDQEWNGMRRTMDKTGARAREPYPNHNYQDHEPMIMKLNRITEEATSRSGIHGRIEAQEGIGGSPDYGNPEEPKHTKEWFVPFTEEYNGKNPIVIAELENKKVRALLDTGAQVHIIGNLTLYNILGDFFPLLRSTRTTATDVKGRPVPILGTITMEVKLGKSARSMVFEVIEGADTLIIGNQLLYDEDLVLIGRRGIGTRKKATEMLNVRQETRIQVYTRDDELVEKGDCKRVTVKVKGPRRHWAININRIFLIDEDEVEGLHIHPTISHLNEEGELIAIISNTSGSQDMTIEKGTQIAQATTEYTEGEELVSEAMAEMAEIQENINHISADEIVDNGRQKQGRSADVMPPGFQLDGPQPGGISENHGKGKYDAERENDGGTWETAHIHFQHENHRNQVRQLLKKHQKIFSKHNYDIGSFTVGGRIQKVKLKVTDKTPIVEKYRQISPAKREQQRPS